MDRKSLSLIEDDPPINFISCQSIDKKPTIRQDKANRHAP